MGLLARAARTLRQRTAALVVRARLGAILRLAPAGMLPVATTTIVHDRPAELRRFGELTPRTQILFSPDDILAAVASADSGDLQHAADICKGLVFADDRAKPVLETRINALLGAPVAFEPGKGRRKRAALKALEAESDYWELLAESELRTHLRWAFALGVSLAELVPYEEAPDGRLVERVRNGRRVRRLRVWDPRNLRQDVWTGRWFLQTTNAGEIEIRPDDPRWWLFTPFGGERPWESGLWRPMGYLCVAKRYAEGDIARYSEVHGRPAIVAESELDIDEAARQKLVAELQKMAGEPRFALPKGIKLKMLEAAAKTYEVFTAQIEIANRALAILAMGTDLPTQVGQGVSTGATAATLVRLDYTRADAEALGTSAHDGPLTVWARDNGFARETVPYPVYQVEPPTDRKAVAEVQKVHSDKFKTLAEAGYFAAPEDVERDCGVRLIAWPGMGAELASGRDPLTPLDDEEEPSAAALIAGEWLALGALERTFAEADDDEPLRAVSNEERDDVHERWSELANMTARELRAWSENACSRKASVRPAAVIARNLRLLETPRAEWGAREVRDAKRAISFISRMRRMPRGRAASKGCPSRRDISLKNWAHDPSK